MFIGHIPAGYLVTRSIWRDTSKVLMITALIGAVLPDLDLFWFYFVDGRSVHHHTYLTHRPALWAIVLLLGIIIKRPIIVVVGTMGLVHMALDSIAGSIAWGWPFTSASHRLVEIPPTQSNWILSFLTHWTFLVEIIITLTAAIVAYRANLRGN